MIREITAMLDGRRIGVRTSLVAVRAGDRIEELGRGVNRHPGVSHNYLRDHPWNLWFTLAVPAERDLGAEVRAILEGEEVPTMVLPALRTFKLQVRLRFTDPGIGIPQQEAPAGGGDDAQPWRSAWSLSRNASWPFSKSRCRWCPGRGRCWPPACGSASAGCWPRWGA